MLVHHADTTAQRGAGIARRQRLAKHPDRALIGRVVAKQDRNQRRLAGTVLTKQRENLSGCERQRDIVVRHQRAEAVRDTGQLENWRRTGARRARYGLHIKRQDRKTRRRLGAGVSGRGIIVVSVAGFGLTVVNGNLEFTAENGFFLRLDFSHQIGRDLVAESAQRRELRALVLHH